MMLHVLGRTGGDLGSATLRNMFEARKRVFVDLLGWDVPVLAGRYEVDQFDDRHALYIVHTDAAGGHRASARLLPTTRPHILDTLFATLCDGDIPRGETVWEITRFCLDRSLRSRDRRIARDELVHALARYGVSHGITLYTGVAGPEWIDQVLAFGWRARLLGEPRETDGATLGAIAIEIDRDTPALLERADIRGAARFAHEAAHAA